MNLPRKLGNKTKFKNLVFPITEKQLDKKDIML